MAVRAVFFDVGETLVDEQRFWRELADANANARRALLQARARIQSDQGIDPDIRDQVLDSLDQEIDRLDVAQQANS